MTRSIQFISRANCRKVLFAWRDRRMSGSRGAVRAWRSKNLYHRRFPSIQSNGSSGRIPRTWVTLLKSACRRVAGLRTKTEHASCWKSSREPIPQNLAGLLFPDSRQWFAVIQYTDIGYVKAADKDSLDADAILKKYQNDVSRQNREHSSMGSRAAITGLSWELKPSFDPVQSKLEYALVAKNSGGGSINYVANWLGRHGMLSVTIVQSERSGLHLEALRDAVKESVSKRRTLHGLPAGGSGGSHGPCGDDP